MRNPDGKAPQHVRRLNLINVAENPLSAKTADSGFFVLRKQSILRMEHSRFLRRGLSWLSHLRRPESCPLWTSHRWILLRL